MKIKYLTKPVIDHLKKLRLPYKVEGIEQECKELMEHIYEGKVNTLFYNEVDAVFIQIDTPEDFEKAVKIASEGHSTTVGLGKEVSIANEKLKQFEAVIIDSNDTSKFDLGIPNLYVAIDHIPSKVELDILFDGVVSGKFQIINLETANQRRPSARGYAPSVGALLDNYGSINVTSVDVSKFVVEGLVKNEDGTEEVAYGFDSQGVLKAQALSTRANLRELTSKAPKEIKFVQMRDAVLGVAISGVKETAEILQWDDNQVDSLINALQGVAHEEALGYAGSLRIPMPMLVTTMEHGEVSAFDEYIRYQKFYTDNNTPCTIEIKEEEIESYKQLILDNWGWYISVDFKVVS